MRVDAALSKGSGYQMASNAALKESAGASPWRTPAPSSVRTL